MPASPCATHCSVVSELIFTKSNKVGTISLSSFIGSRSKSKWTKSFVLGHCCEETEIQTQNASGPSTPARSGGYEPQGRGRSQGSCWQVTPMRGRGKRALRGCSPTLALQCPAIRRPGYEGVFLGSVGWGVVSQGSSPGV